MATSEVTEIATTGTVTGKRSAAPAPSRKTARGTAQGRASTGVLQGPVVDPAQAAGQAQEGPRDQRPPEGDQTSQAQEVEGGRRGV